MAESGGSADVLSAVRRLFEEPRFQDVHFTCLDGRVVSSNRAFLAARCEYFERLLFGPGFLEASCSEIRLQASSEAVRHVLMHLHTGGFGSIEQEGCWITLLEASSLAQQYMLPTMVQHVADRLSADLRPENLGLALSYALKADLQAVIKSIWVSLPRLLQRPLALDRSFSADAICFCLRHTAWMAPLAASGAGPMSGAAHAAGAGAGAGSGGAAGLAAAAAAAAGLAAGAAAEPQDGGAMRRMSSTNGASAGGSSAYPQQHPEGAVVSSRCLAACKVDSTAQEAQAFAAVIAWVLQEVGDCADCACSRHAVLHSSSQEGLEGEQGATLPLLQHQHQQLLPASPCFSARSRTADGGGGSPSSRTQGKPPLSLGNGGSGGSSSRMAAAGAADMDRSRSMSPSLSEINSQPQHPAMVQPGSRPSSRQQAVADAGAPEAAAQRAAAAGTSAAERRLSGRGSLLSSLDSEAGEARGAGGPDAQLLIDAAGVYAVLSVVTPPTAAPAAAAAAAGPGGTSHTNAGSRSSSAAAAAGALVSPSGLAAGAGGAGPEAAAAAAAGDADRRALQEGEQQEQQQEEVGDVEEQQEAVGEQEEQELCYTGCCCAAHEGMLLQMLAHLNWHLLEPCVLEQLHSLALLGPTAMLELYKAHQRCSHMALWGNFPSLSLGSERGLRCFSSGGEQVLECESVSHLTAVSSLAFTSGKHCWQFVVAVPCDLVWLGISDGSLQPDVWGGKQPGGWFYGSNDALCHNKQSDRHAYTKHCGNGKWGEDAVVDVCLDMDAREVWFGVDGAEPKLGFTGLPDRVYPAVSLRAPAQLLVQFRAASWLTAEWTRHCGGGGAAAASGGAGSGSE